jgi:hypothetical protein
MSFQPVVIIGGDGQKHILRSSVDSTKIAGDLACCCGACTNPCEPDGWQWFTCTITDWAAFVAALDLSDCDPLACDASCLIPPDDCITPPFPLPFAWNPNTGTCGQVFQWYGAFTGQLTSGCGIVALDYTTASNILAIGNVPVYAVLSFDIVACEWVLAVFCGIDGLGDIIWAGAKSGGATPAGVYTRFGGTSATPATATIGI